MGLFGGKPDSKPAPSAPPSREQPRSQRAEPETAAATVLGREAIVKGELRSKGDMLVEGRVEGRIQSNKRVIVGESGDVEALIEAQVVTVRGKVHGDCHATTKVEITSTGKVLGNISAPAIVVAEGATFRGSSKMEKPEPKPSEPPRPVSTPAGASPNAPARNNPQ